MSKIEKAEQIIPDDNVEAAAESRDSGRNKSKSSSMKEQQEQSQCHRPARIVKSASQGSSPPGLQHSTTPEHMRGATKDMFDLIERVQCSRLDDQRCVLPAYFSQIPF